MPVYHGKLQNGVWTTHTSSKQGRPLPRLNSPHSWPAQRCVHFHKSLWNTTCSVCNNVYIKERIREEQSGISVPVKVNGDFGTWSFSTCRLTMQFSTFSKVSWTPHACLFGISLHCGHGTLALFSQSVGSRKASCSFALCSSDIQILAALNKHGHVNVHLRGWERNRKKKEMHTPS